MKSEEKNKMIKEFTDLRTWQACRDLTVRVYQITARFPRDELYALTSQMRRAATSSAANIAEGFGRSSKADREHFYVMALGSLTELKSHALLARELQYFDDETLDLLVETQAAAAQQLQALLRTHRATFRVSSLKSQAS